MVQNRSQICCLVFLSNTGNYRNKKLHDKEREGRREGNFNLYPLSFQFFSSLYFFSSHILSIQYRHQQLYTTFFKIAFTCLCCIDKLCLCFMFRFPMLYCKFVLHFIVQWVVKKKKKMEIKK